MTDVLFVHPNASKKIYQSLSKDLSAIEPPIWAALLANGVRQHGYEVDILDCEAEGLNPVESMARIKESGAPLVVIVVYGQQPSASTQNMTGVMELVWAHMLDSTGPYPTFLVVGAHPSALPEHTLKEMGRGPYLVAKGEGLYTILDLLQTEQDARRRRSTELQSVRGLVWPDYLGKPLINEPAPLVTQPNMPKELPGMAWDLLPIDNYRTSNWHSWTNDCERQPFASIYTSLGCPFHCSFCMINAPFGGSSFRYWDPEFIVKHELKQLADRGVRNLKIADEMFVLNRNHFMKLCEGIIREGYDFNIWAYARIDTVRDEYLETLKKAGVNWLALGIESGNRKVRQDVVKGKFQEIDIVDIVTKIRAAGIHVIGNFIFGLPEDDLDSMHQTFDLALELKCEMVNFYSAMAYPGSYLYEDAIRNGKQLPESWLGYSQHAKETRPLDTKYISHREVLGFRDAAFKKYFTHEPYLEHVEKTFGSHIRGEINRMLSHELERDHADPIVL